LKFITERERERKKDREGEREREREREKERNLIFIISQKKENKQLKYFSNKTLSSGHRIRIAMIMRIAQGNGNLRYGYGVALAKS